jgi:hypothetical protein
MRGLLQLEIQVWLLLLPNQLKLQKGYINQSQTSYINVMQFNNALWFTFHSIFQKIIWPIWRCDSLNVHVCTPQYQCSIVIRHHILIFISWTIVLPPSSWVVQTTQKPFEYFKQWLNFEYFNIHYNVNIVLIMEIVLNERFDCHGIDIILKFTF